MELILGTGLAAAAIIAAAGLVAARHPDRAGVALVLVAAAVSGLLVLLGAPWAAGALLSVQAGMALVLSRHGGGAGSHGGGWAAWFAFAASGAALLAALVPASPAAIGAAALASGTPVPGIAGLAGLAAVLGVGAVWRSRSASIDSSASGSAGPVEEDA